MERREFLTWSGGMLMLGALAGCGAGKVAGLAPGDDGIHLSFVPERRIGKTPDAFRRPAGPSTQAPGARAEPLAAISRTCWGADAPIASRLRRMNGIERITIHHEGAPKGNWETSPALVSRRLRRIQQEHRQRMHAADIGYHFIVDRSGRVWQGRGLDYQGAHVKHKNPHNIGIMCLGNFEMQQPARGQVQSLETLVQMLLHGYDIPAKQLCAHRELGATACPGKYMMPHIRFMRSRFAVA